MVTLNEQIDIPAPFEKIQAWLDNFEREFVKWSPYHLECNLYDGDTRQETGFVSMKLLWAGLRCDRQDHGE